jgi:hypothetical protein
MFQLITASQCPESNAIIPNMHEAQRPHGIRITPAGNSDKRTLVTWYTKWTQKFAINNGHSTNLTVEVSVQNRATAMIDTKMQKFRLLEPKSANPFPPVRLQLLVKYNVLTAVKTLMFIRIITSCGLEGRYKSFGGTYCLYLQGRLCFFPLPADILDTMHLFSHSWMHPGGATGK